MIFVTVGTQLPFDRLIRAVDEIAPHLNGEKVIAQTNGGEYTAVNMECKPYFGADEFNALISQSRMIISHAGTGSIISAMTHMKPIIIMPRLASLREHRNEHQMATAKKMEELRFVNVAYDEQQLQALILSSKIKCLQGLGNRAPDRLISSLRRFILGR